MRLAFLSLLLAVAGCASLPPKGEEGEPKIITTPVPLDGQAAAHDRVGRLRYLGGLALTSPDKRFGGLSGLRWDGRQLVAVGDTGTIVSLIPREDAAARLVGIASARLKPLLDPEGVPLAGKADGDAESITGDGEGGWLVGFEGNHRIWRYRRFGGPAEPTAIDPQRLLGPLESNSGVEALAGSPAAPILCAERQAGPDRPNCWDGHPFAALPPPEIGARGGVPTDMDELGGRGHLLVLFRSFSLMAGAGAAVVERLPDGSIRPVATLLPPLTLDNMEGLAVRRADGRTFVYLLSDDNFNPFQRTLLMKFELLP